MKPILARLTVPATLAIALALTTSCATMRVLNRWSQPGMSAPIRSMLVVALDTDPSHRRIMEDAFVHGLARHGVIATPSYQVWGATLPDTEAVRAWVRAQGVNGMLVAARMKSEEYRQISRGYVSADPLAANRSWSGRYHRYYYEVKHEASAEAGREVPHRVDVWQADGKGGQMVWTALGRGVDPASADDVGREVTKSLVPEMARAGVIPD